MVRPVESPHQPDEVCVEALFEASRALVGVAARSLAGLPADLTIPQVRVLVLLGSRGPLPVSTLADLLGVHPSTATRMVDRLSAKKLVLRRAAPDDRRTTMLVLSAAGSRALERITDARKRELRSLVAALSPTECDAITGALHRFALVAGEAADESWVLAWADA